jgi:hypothetical protein
MLRGGKSKAAGSSQFAFSEWRWLGLRSNLICEGEYGAVDRPKEELEGVREGRMSLFRSS